MTQVRILDICPSADQLTIVIPAYNEELGLEPTLRALRDELRLDGARVIVIDDGSTDNTSDVAYRFGATVLRNRTNLGYGASLKKGIQSVETPLLAWFDADGQHRPSDLADMLECLHAEDADAVIGARTRASHAPRRRAPGKMVIKFAAEAAIGDKIPDVNCGLRLFRRDILNQYVHLLPDGFSASTTSTLLFIKRKYHVLFHPVEVDQRVGKSSVRQFRDGFRTLHTILRILILFNAFKSFTWLAAVTVLGGLTYGLPVALMNGRGFPVLAEMFIVLGVQIFCMGVICDQISAMRLERLETPRVSRTETKRKRTSQQAA